MTMWKALTVGCIALLALCRVDAQDPDPVKALIEKLGSASFKTREAATKALLERPDAEDALRAAMRSKDLEFSRRVAAIVEKLVFRRSPVRKLEKAIEEGRVPHVIELITEWPAGMEEVAVWKRMQGFSVDLTNRCKKARDRGANGADTRYVLSTPMPQMSIRVKQFSQRSGNREIWRGHFFLVADEVDYDDASRKRGEGRPWVAGVLVVAGGRVRIAEPSFGGNMILANGRVELKGSFQNSIIVSCSDVVLSSGNLENCLIIAKGAVDASKGSMDRCSIYAGKAVSFHKVYADRSVIVENEANPLGYIRWADTPKQKAPAKKK